MPTPTVFVPLFGTPKSQTNWSTLLTATTDYYMGKIQSSGVQNAEISFDFACDAGTYTFVLFNRQTTSAGIYTVQIDGSPVGTIDGYAATPATARSSITGLVLTNGVHTLRLLMATKNGSSSSYFGFAEAVTFVKTA